jgi:hypothetical protein
MPFLEQALEKIGEAYRGAGSEFGYRIEKYGAGQV